MNCRCLKNDNQFIGPHHAQYCFRYNKVLAVVIDGWYYHGRSIATSYGLLLNNMTAVAKALGLYEEDERDATIG